jgi:hypothetical protein
LDEAKYDDLMEDYTRSQSVFESVSSCEVGRLAFQRAIVSLWPVTDSMQNS